jgi:hypothetical protein
VGDLAVDQHVQDAQGVRGLLEEQAAAVEVRGQEQAEAGSLKVRKDVLRAELAGLRLDGTTLDGTTLDGTTLDGTTLDGTALDGTAP